MPWCRRGSRSTRGRGSGHFSWCPQEIRADLQAEILKRRLPPKQVAVLEVLCRSDEPLTVADVCRLAKCTTVPIQGLRKQGLVTTVRRRLPVGLPNHDAPGPSPPKQDNTGSPASPNRTSPATITADADRRAGGHPGAARAGDRRRGDSHRFWFMG